MNVFTLRQNVRSIYRPHVCKFFIVYCNKFFCVNNIVVLKVIISKSSHFEDTIVLVLSKG